MKIKALRTIFGEYGQIVRNEVGEVSNETGRQLIAKGYAEADEPDVAAKEPAVEPTVEPVTDPAPKKKAKPNATDKNS